MNTPEMKWYILFTKAGLERKVTDFLARKKIESFCPQHSAYNHSAEFKKSSFQPLFKSFVFVRLTQTCDLHFKNSDGIINFIYWLDKPAIIPDEEINMIKRFLHNYQTVQLEKIVVDPKAEVKIIKGIFIKQNGDRTQIKNKSTKIFLPALGYALVAETEKNLGEVLTVFKENEDSVEKNLLQ